MAEQTFNPQTSKLAQQLDSLTSEELFHRYFTKNQGENWIKDFNNEVNISTVNQEEKTVKYKYLWAHGLLDGYPLSFIVSSINNAVSVYAEETLPNYKLNAAAIATDLEFFLKENMILTSKARETRKESKQTKFIIDLTDYLVEKISDAYSYTIANSVT